MSQEPIGFLLGLGERPRPLFAGSTLTFGREAANTHVLSDGLLSRRHLALEVQFAGLVMVSDLGSTNGSYLNDKRLPPNVPLPMKSGDVIRFGKQVLTLVAGQAEPAVSSAFIGKTPPPPRVRAAMPFDGRVAGASPGEPTRRHDPVGPRRTSKATVVGALSPEEEARLNRPCPLAGRLEEQLFPQLLQHIHGLNLTGELIVELGEHEAIIAFESGQIVFAMWGTLLGLDAIGSVAERGAGAYHFKRMPLLQRPRNIEAETRAIILQCCHFYSDLGQGA